MWGLWSSSSFQLNFSFLTNKEVMNLSKGKNSVIGNVFRKYIGECMVDTRVSDPDMDSGHKLCRKYSKNYLIQKNFKITTD